jgi:hypothetical protein
MATHQRRKEFSPGSRLVLETTVFPLSITENYSLHGLVRELYQDNGISNRINQSMNRIRMRSFR